ncbi:MAG: LuxR C-terminal-related transcriptional regulator [Lachnospiraceae bacterium]|jgi:DNA-binding CsgD family transcriptional regulator|nr:LuxR C-terminal-related transcriptional regulator [Lachnospiraceae bacterium]
MNWMTASEAASKWGIKVRQVQLLCASGKIPEASRLGRQWLIPLAATKPHDGRSRKMTGGKVRDDNSRSNQGDELAAFREVPIPALAITSDAEKETIPYFLTEDEPRCFLTTTLHLYKQDGDLNAFVTSLFDLAEHMTKDIATFADEILTAAPPDIMRSIPVFAATHLRLLIGVGKFDCAMKLAKNYEEKLWENPHCHHALFLLYQEWERAVMLQATFGENSDFSRYFVKMSECLLHLRQNDGSYSEEILAKFPLSLTAYHSNVGSVSLGSAAGYIEILTKSVNAISSHFPVRPPLFPCYNYCFISVADIELAHGELLFFQGEVVRAEAFLRKAVTLAQATGQILVRQKALYYSLRIACIQGKYDRCEEVMVAAKDMSRSGGVAKASPVDNGQMKKEWDVAVRAYDLLRGWYYTYLRQPQMIPYRLKGDFAPYFHANASENAANLIRSRYHFLTRADLPLLSYLDESCEREAVLFARVEAAAMAACVYWRSKNKAMAFHWLQKAYDNARGNEIIMPFIELGKDMRTLAKAAISQEGHDIPESWLWTVMRMASSYAKRQSLLIGEYRKAAGIGDIRELSYREKEVLRDLQHGLSRHEIAVSQQLAIGTVNTVINGICTKLGVHNVGEAVRVMGRGE